MVAPVRVALRRRGAELCLLALIAAATSLAPTFAQACVSDAECDDLDACSEIDTCEAGVCVAGGGGDGDGDGTCEADDNCPGFANASQDDLDGDGDGDGCDDVDRVLNVVVARIKKNINTPIKPTGGLLARGDFLAAPPEPPLSAATGMLVRIQDSVMLDRSFSWTPAECATNAKGRIKCQSPDKKQGLIVKPVNGSNGTLFRYTFRATRIDIQGPFFLPMTVTLTTGPGAPPTLVEGLDRQGDITDCRQTNIGMSCRE